MFYGWQQTCQSTASLFNEDTRLDSLWNTEVSFSKLWSSHFLQILLLNMVSSAFSCSNQYVNWDPDWKTRISSSIVLSSDQQLHFQCLPYCDRCQSFQYCWHWVQRDVSDVAVCSPNCLDIPLIPLIWVTLWNIVTILIVIHACCLYSIVVRCWARLCDACCLCIIEKCDALLCDRFRTRILMVIKDSWLCVLILSGALRSSLNGSKKLRCYSSTRRARYLPVGLTTWSLTLLFFL